MTVERNETLLNILEDREYKKAFLKMFIKAIPMQDFYTARRMISAFRRECAITTSESVMLDKWNWLMHGSGCFEWGR